LRRTSWAAIGAVAASLVAVFLDGPTGLLGLCLVAVAALALVSRAARRTRRAALAPMAFAASLVLVRAMVGSVVAVPGPSSVADGTAGTHHTAVVVSLGTPDGGLQRAVVQLRPPESADAVYVWLPRYPQLAQADEIDFSARLEDPPESGDFADYLARSGIGHTARASAFELLGSDGSPVAALEGLRRGAADLITRVLPEPQAGLATAMAIGLRDVVSRDVTADFRDSGLSHVVAISGWHIAMLGAVVAALLGGLPRRPRSVIVVVAIFGYAFLAGAAPSILRAAVMAAAVIVARESGRRGQASSALALTVIALLLLDPLTITDVGFQLSATATAGLLAWATPLHAWLVRHAPMKTPGWLVEALAVSLAAQASTLPLILLEFGRLSIVAPIANLLIAPLVAPAMLVTATCFVAGAAVTAGIPTLVIAPVTLIGSLCIGAMIAIAHLCASLPFANVALPEPLNEVAAGASAVAIALVVRRSKSRAAKRDRSDAQYAHPKNRKPPQRISRRRLAVAGGAVSMSLLVAVVAVARPDGRLHVTVLDVGQGDSIFLQGPNGGRVLIDTGPDPDRLLTLLDARVPSWDRRLDLVVLTHPHEDHVSGLALLLQRYRIGDIVEPGMIGPGPGDAAYRREMAQLGRTSRVVAAGDRLWLDGIELDVDWPLRGTVPLHPADGGTAINNVSIVLELHFGQRRMLFTGDVEQQIDPQLLAEGIAAHLGAPIDVLKVAHHGSGTASTDAFVNALDPGVAVISAGWGNPYGHPSPKTVTRLQDHGAKLFRTDLDGNVDISTNGRDLVAQAEGGRPHPVKQTPSPPPGIGFCPIYSETAGRRRRRTYNRADVDPNARGSCCDRARVAAEREAAPSLDRRCRGRGLSGRCNGPPRYRPQRDARRGGRAPPRHGQDAARR
jgi:competence protein ComEC